MLNPDTSFFIDGGTLPNGAPSYVEREADHELRFALQNGEFSYILDTRQVGKSSLMVRTAAWLRREGGCVAVLDLTRIGQATSIEQWYYGLLLDVGGQLGLRDSLRAFWQQNKQMGPWQRWIEALRQCALEPNEEPLTIFIDEIDNVLSLPFSTDELFAGIRECFNRRAIDPAFSRLTFCLVGSATPDDLIRDVRNTPFNIGRRIQPTDFTAAEAMPLAAGLSHSEKVGRRLLQRVLYWSGGHPYITQRLCRAIAEVPPPPGEEQEGSHCRGSIPSVAAANALVDRICSQLFLARESRETETNLTFVANRILRSGVDIASLLDLYRQVRQSGGGAASSGVGLRRKIVRDDPANPFCTVLKLSGLVRVDDGRLALRNRIYERVFDAAWIQNHMPDAELRRQRRAFRRGLVRATLVYGIAIAVMAALSATALYQRSQAASNALRADRNAYQANVARLAAERSADIARREAERADRMARSLALESRRVSRLAGERKRALDEAVEERNRAAANAKRADEQAVAAHRAAHRARTETRRATINLARANRAETAARASAQAAERHSYEVYASHMDIARRELEAANAGTAIAFLDAHALEKRRGVEYSHLTRLANLDEKTLRGHNKPVTGVFWASEGRRLITAGEDGRIRIWETATGRPVRTIDSAYSEAYSSTTSDPTAVSSDAPLLNLWKKTGGVFTHITGTRDGKRAATVENNLVHLWDLESGRPVRVLSGHTERVRQTAFSPDERYLASAGTDATVRIWDARSGQLVKTLVDPAPSPLNCVAFSPDGKTLLCGRDDGAAAVWDVETGTRTRTLKGHTGSVLAVAYSPDGQKAATGGSDRMLRLWSVETGMSLPAAPASASSSPAAAIPSLPLHTEAITSIACSPNGDRWATASQDRTIGIWSAAGAPVTRLIGHTDRVSMAVFAPDGRLASVSADGTAKIWDIDRVSASLIVARHKDDVNAIAYSANGRWAATASDDGTVQLLDGRTLKLVRTFAKEKHQFYGVALSADGKRLAAGGGETVQVKTADGSARDSSSISSEHGGTFVWDVETGRQIVHITGGTSLVAMSPDGSRVVTSRDGLPQVWDARTGLRLADLRGHQGGVNWAACSPDGTQVVTVGEEDGTARIFDLRTGKPLRVLRGHKYGIWDVRYSRDGRYLVTAGDDGTAIVWSARTGERIRRFSAAAHGREDWLYTAAFDAQARQLITVGENKVLRIWDIRTGRQVLATNEDIPSISHIAVSPDDRNVLMASYDDTVRLWRQMSDQEMAERRSAALADAARLSAEEREREAKWNQLREKAIAARRAAVEPRLPRRDPAARPQLLDLTPYYNALLDESWHRIKNNDLAELPKGVQTLAGTEFDIRGIVQLHSKELAADGTPYSYPLAVKNIRVARQAGRVSFLIGTGWPEDHNVQIGEFVLHYENGYSRRFPIVYGRDVRDWISDSNPDVKSPVAWRGHNAYTRSVKDIQIRLFKMTWTNPLPHLKVRSFDFVSADTTSAPFLIAATVE